MLGINRNTLRAKLAKYKLISSRLRRMAAKSRRRCCRSPTRRAWSNSPARSPRSASPCCRPAAPRGCCRGGRPRHRGAGYTGFPRDARRAREDAAPEDPRRACWRGATSRHIAAISQRTPSRRSTWSSSTCTRFGRRSRGPDCTLDEAIENIDIGGPAHAARGGEELAARRGRRRSGRLRAVLAEIGAPRRRDCPTSAALALMQRAFAHTAAYDGAIANYLHGSRRPAAQVSRLPAVAPSTRRTSCRRCATARTRTSAPRSTATRVPPPATRRRIASCRARSSPTTTSPTPTRHGDASRAFVGPDLRHRQARQSLRRRDRRAPSRRLPGGVRHRSGLGVRRHHRLQSPARRDDARRGGGAVRRGGDRAPRTRPTRCRCSPARRTCGCWSSRCPARRREQANGTSSASAAACSCRAPTMRAIDAADLRVVTEAVPTRRAARRPAVRMARREVREVERDRVLRGPAHARRRRRADEPRRHRPASPRSRRKTPGFRSPARSSPRTPSSRSATGWTSSPTRARWR